jgi:GNAT superfamily N-acetyltransferase
MEWQRGEYRISTDRAQLSLDTIRAFLSRSYWAADRSKETIEQAVDHSLCYGVYHRDQQVGFARVVTDYTTFYWLCDVFIDEAHRGRGLGKWLMECILATPEVKRQEFGVLATRDAQGLYAQYGFQQAGQAAKSFMYRLREDLARKREEKRKQKRGDRP